eukprot:scaffold15832_cov42-Phaeocystis_antarctica.AAC.1
MGERVRQASSLGQHADSLKRLAPHGVQRFHLSRPCATVFVPPWSCSTQPWILSDSRASPHRSRLRLQPSCEGHAARRAAAWLGFETVPHCRLRVDQGLGSLPGLLQADVTGKRSDDDGTSATRASPGRRGSSQGGVEGQ